MSRRPRGCASGTTLACLLQLRAAQCSFCSRCGLKASQRPLKQICSGRTARSKHCVLAAVARLRGGRSKQPRAHLCAPAPQKSVGGSEVRRSERRRSPIARRAHRLRLRRARTNDTESPRAYDSPDSASAAQFSLGCAR
eukprot:361200-Chlamydomonas_euryale.AAC.6